MVTSIDFTRILDEEKFKELLLYVADKCSDDPDFGATKLNKILFYADFQAYGLYGEPITGSPYFKLRRGPAPKYLKPIRDNMEGDGDIVIQHKQRFNQTQHRIIPLKEANLDVFYAKEIALVDKVIEAFCGINADGASKVSHMEAGYNIAGNKEDIPYEAVFLSSRSLTEYEVRHGLELAETCGWAI